MCQSMSPGSTNFLWIKVRQETDNMCIRVLSIYGHKRTHQVKLYFFTPFSIGFLSSSCISRSIGCYDFGFILKKSSLLSIKMSSSSWVTLLKLIKTKFWRAVYPLQYIYHGYIGFVIVTVVAFHCRTKFNVQQVANFCRP